LDEKEIPPREDVVFPAIYEGTLRFLRVIPKSAAADALDLCSGTGIAALVMSRSARRIVACDVTARAAHFAEFNRRLNHCHNVEVVTGDLYSALGNQSFDRIVAHPPFVPGRSHAFIYRDSGENGEALIKRIIEGLARYLRPGGSFYGICAAWDSKDGFFEERARGWLGKERDEFDVIFALQRQLSPDDVAGRVAELSAPDGMSRPGWSELFRRAGFASNVYGAIVIRRSFVGEALRPVTQRVRLGTLTDGSALEWALRWYSWRKRNETRGDFISTLCSMRPRLSPYLKAKVTHEVGQGSLVPTDVVLEVDRPFPSACRVEPWMLHLLAEFDGQRNVEAVHEAAKQVLPIPESFAVDDFARLVANMIERGCLEIEDDALGQRALKNSGPVSKGST
jgi:methylase of polypeptide subunit release factors